MQPPVLSDWKYILEEAAKKSNLRKRTFEKYLSLGDTIEMAMDMELHANFLLDEALSRERSILASSTVIDLPKATSQPVSSFPPTSHQNKYMDTASMQPKTKPFRVPASDDNFEQIPSFSRKNSENKREREVNSKEPICFSSAKETFIEEGGMFKHKKEDFKSAAGYTTISNKKTSENPLPSELANHDKALVEKIEAEIIHHGQPVKFDDISGLEFAKQCVIESVCWPISNPHLFQGLRSIPRGILLFGPPGTGKTLIGKAIANQSGATFFSISASSLMSKWIGEGERTVKTLFAVAAFRQPSVVFIDEIDSLLCQRSSDENEATRRIKTEFLVQLDGAGTDLNARVVIVGATNRPEELDEAVRRRFVKRLYIPLPDVESRSQLFDNLLRKVNHELSSEQIFALVEKTRGYSGADIQSLCADAAMGPLRDLARSFRGQMESISPSEVPPIKVEHFESALNTVQPSVSPGDLKRYLDWNTLFGSYRLPDET